MQALHLGPDGLKLRDDTPRPRPEPEEALVRVLKAGICATDLELVKGYAGFRGVLGHEFVGVVEEAADDGMIGRRVVGTINLGCRRCPICIGSGPEHCPRRTVLGIIGRDGAFAEYLTLPVANLLEVPAAIPDEAAVFTEPLAAALRIREQLTISPSAAVAVVGPGRLGLLIAQVLVLAGTRLTVLGRRPESLELPARLGLVTGLVDDFADDRFDLVVEATGNEAGLAESLRLVRPLGTLVLKSTFQGAASVDLTKLVVGEITVVGSRCGPFAPALRLLAASAVEVVAMIEAQYPLAEGVVAMEHAARPGVRKILLVAG
ncbi:MAG: alcohol dehydrogenase catalytic domain-containing protein [bacterium]|nr:alcohol dehydrogenase catalytic domain-containing protein [bacterium]